MRYWAAILVGIVISMISTVLLWEGRIAQAYWLGALGLAVFASLSIALLDRLQGISIGLSKAEMTLSQIEKVKEEVERCYSGIQHLKRTPFALGHSKMQDLGLNPGHLCRSDAVMRFCVGVVKRERERLAKVFAEPRTPTRIAEAILDGSLDELVFKWEGPEVLLDTTPRSTSQREREKSM